MVGPLKASQFPGQAFLSVSLSLSALEFPTLIQYGVVIVKQKITEKNTRLYKPFILIINKKHPEFFLLLPYSFSHIMMLYTIRRTGNKTRRKPPVFVHSRSHAYLTF